MQEELSLCLLKCLLSDPLAGTAYLYGEHNGHLLERHMNKLFPVEPCLPGTDISASPTTTLVKELRHCKVYPSIV